MIPGSRPVAVVRKHERVGGSRGWPIQSSRYSVGRRRGVTTGLRPSAYDCGVTAKLSAAPSDQRWPRTTTGALRR